MVPEGLSSSPGLPTTTASLRKQKVLISPARSANISDWLRTQTQLCFIAYCARGINKPEIKNNPQGITLLGWKGLGTSFVFACSEVSERQESDLSLCLHRDPWLILCSQEIIFCTSVCLEFKRESCPSKSGQLTGESCLISVEMCSSLGPAFSGKTRYFLLNYIQIGPVLLADNCCILLTGAEVRMGSSARRQVVLTSALS